MNKEDCMHIRDHFYVKAERAYTKRCRVDLSNRCFLCMWIPCVIDGCKDVVHTCPSCGMILGRNAKFGAGAAYRRRGYYLTRHTLMCLIRCYKVDFTEILLRNLLRSFCNFSQLFSHHRLSGITAALY